MTAIPVKVAVRCRPLTPKEEDEGSLLCVHFPNNAPVIVIGKKPFTFNYVFSPESNQEAIYEETVFPLIANIIKGYNATVFAYGQTGSGKTYTMGGSCSGVELDGSTGIIPRVLKDLFSMFQQEDAYQFNASVSYLEIYNEEVRDLLNKNRKDTLHVREDCSGIKIPGLTEVSVNDYSSTVKCLEDGAQARSVGSTAMNTVSSRSHAIFTFHVDITSKTDSNECFKSKLHLVDLAGSERIKKTLAEGSRLKEGISINKGLLSLGNVISSLGEDSRHIPYRDSKLTRLLQDSLGGNSYTLMIACISPADSNMEESVNTMRYADRASKIKNKPLVNHDPKVAEIVSLKNMVAQLQAELIQVTGNIDHSENYQQLQERISELEKEIDSLTKELNSSLERNAQQLEQIMYLETQNENQKIQLGSLLEVCSKVKAKNGDEESEPLEEHYEELKITIESQLGNPNVEEMDLSLEADANSSVDLTSYESRQYTTQYALKQAAMSRELNELNQILLKKERLAAQMAKRNLEEIRSRFESDKRSLQSKIDALLKEKSDLESALSSASSSKVSESRIERVNELEHKLLLLKREMANKENAMKNKKPFETKITSLNAEIMNMKSQKVKLMKQMKEEGDSFKKWKMQKVKEVNKLMQKDRKREFEMQKLKKTHEKQQCILKRKSEEASAANKRLKEALNKQKLVRNERLHSFEIFGTSKYALSMKSMLEREIDVKVSLEETKHHLKTLMTDRAILNSQIKELNAGLSQPIKKRKLDDDKTNSLNDSSHIEEIKNQVKELNENLKIRNAQITEMQFKIQDCEFDKSKPVWETFHSMNEAKLTLKFLFEKVVTEKVKALFLGSQLKEVEQSKEVVEANLDGKKSEMESLQKSHESQKLEVMQKYENKILQIMKKVRKFTSENLNISMDDEMSLKLDEQVSYDEIIKSLNDQIDVQKEEIKALEAQIRRDVQTPDLFDSEYSISEHSDDSDWVTPYVKKVRKVLQKTCSCKVGCKKGRCGCYKREHLCTAYCQCGAECENGAPDEYSDEPAVRIPESKILFEDA